MRITAKKLSKLCDMILLVGTLACIAAGLILLLCGCAYTHQRLFLGIEEIPLFPRIEVENEILFREPYNEKDFAVPVTDNAVHDGRGVL